MPDPTERYDTPSSKGQEFNKRVLINRTRPEKCDKIFTLYQLMHYKENEKSSMNQPMTTNCDRPFIVVPIPMTNMILLVVNTMCNPTDPVYFNNKPVEKHYNASSLQCYKIRNQFLYRRQLKYCFNKHHNESGIELCGNANRFHLSFHILSLTVIVVIKHFF